MTTSSSPLQIVLLVLAGCGCCLLPTVLLRAEHGGEIRSLRRELSLANWRAEGMHDGWITLLMHKHNETHNETVRLEGRVRDQQRQLDALMAGTQAGHAYTANITTRHPDHHHESGMQHTPPHPSDEADMDADPRDGQPPPSPPPPPPPPLPPLSPWKPEEEMAMANSWPRSCGCEASITVIKADMQTLNVGHQALKLRADRTEARVADLFAGVLAKEQDAALFEQVIAGERRQLQTAECATRAGAVTSACCSSVGHRLLQDGDCSGLPKQCSASCAPLFIAFRSECEEMMEEAGFVMQEVERLHESCLEQVSADEGSCGAQIGRRVLQRMDGSADITSNTGATAAMIIPLIIVTNGDTGMLEVLSQNGRRSLQQGGAEAVQEFRCECGSGTDISSCIPVCDESIHGFELLLTIDQSDLRVSCKLHAGLFSWAGAVSEGSYFGDDAELFISMLVSGAEGQYVLKLRVSPDLQTELTVQRNQVVQISGDRALPAAPTWGSGGFVVGEGGYLALEYIALLGSSDNPSDAILIVNAGGRLSVADSQLVPIGVEQTWASRVRKLPLPCDGLSSDGLCRGPHTTSVLVEKPLSVSLAVPLVCGFWTPEDCVALPAGLTPEQRARGLAAGIPWNADPVCFGEYVTVPDDPDLTTDAGQGVGETSFYPAGAPIPNYDPTMPSTYRCDSAEGPFGLRQSNTAWYRFPDGKSLPTAPPGDHRCGTPWTGWLTGWPAGADGIPGQYYTTPADGTLPPPVGEPPLAGAVCFNSWAEGLPSTTPCTEPVPIRAVSCGAFALWELPPTSEGHCYGYCLAEDPCASCAANEQCAINSYSGYPRGYHCVHDDVAPGTGGLSQTLLGYGTCSSRCGQSPVPPTSVVRAWTETTQCCVCDCECPYHGQCACATGWTGAVCNVPPPPGLPLGVSQKQYDRAITDGVDPAADLVCFTAAYITVPDDRRLTTAVTSLGDGGGGMPLGWRCDDAESPRGGGPFALGQSDTAWYRFPAGKTLPTEPLGWRCGLHATGWLSAWPVGAAEQPPDNYDTPGTSLPPEVGGAPEAGSVCFGVLAGNGRHKCDHVSTVRAVSCGAFALWELTPSRGFCPGTSPGIGYCLTS